MRVCDGPSGIPRGVVFFLDTTHVMSYGGRVGRTTKHRRPWIDGYCAIIRRENRHYLNRRLSHPRMPKIDVSERAIEFSAHAMFHGDLRRLMISEICVDPIIRHGKRGPGEW